MYNPNNNKSTGYENKIIESWGQNARCWIKAVREGQIESRRKITDQFILEVIINCKPNSVIDIGCGEGWLVRELTTKGMNVLGIDIIAHLIESAQQLSDGKYQLLSYDEMARGELNSKFDLAVCNFSLIGKESVESIFANTTRFLHSGGYFIVQTLHPRMAAGDLPYEDGWREGSWNGFSKEFSNPAPWYFRTVKSWLKLFTDNGLCSPEIIQPLYAESQKPASIIFIGKTPNQSFC